MPDGAVRLDARHFNDTNNLLIGDDNNDRLYAGGGDDVVYGEAGNDILYGDTGNDHLLSGEGHDILYGGDNNDRLFGGTGIDQLTGGTGNDYLEGGAGKDFYFFEGNFRQDAVVDSGNNILLIKGETVTAAIDDGSGNYQTVDGNYTLPKSGTNLIVSDAAGNRITVMDWQEGDYGDRLFDAPENIETVNTITGDGTPVDTSGASPGIIYEWYECNNLVFEDDGVAKSDVLKVRAANDKIFGGALGDILHGFCGSIILRRGAGEDRLNDWGGNNFIEVNVSPPSNEARIFHKETA